MRVIPKSAAIYLQYKSLVLNQNPNGSAKKNLIMSLASSLWVS